MKPIIFNTEQVRHILEISKEDLEREVEEWKMKGEKE